MNNQFACLFPGQGSQSVGMLSVIAEQFPSIIHTFNQVSDELGYDLWALTQLGPESQLNQTEYTQVAMLTADVAIYHLLQSQGMKKPTMMAGHSLGEYAALVSSGAMDLVTAAKLVEKRGQLMQSTIPSGKGAMAAIVGLTDEEVKQICLEASQKDSIVTPANFNAIGQVVVAGHTDAVNNAIQIAENLNARMAVIIPVSVPCHCPLLLEAAEAFGEYLLRADIKIPQVEVVSNVNLSVYRSSEQIKTLLKEQLYKPVRWVETIQLMSQHGVALFVECGPGKVLSGLVKRIDRALTTANVFDKASLENVLTEMSCKEQV